MTGVRQGGGSQGREFPKLAIEHGIEGTELGFVVGVGAMVGELPLVEDPLDRDRVGSPCARLLSLVRLARVSSPPRRRNSFFSSCNCSPNQFLASLRSLLMRSLPEGSESCSAVHCARARLRSMRSRYRCW